VLIGRYYILNGDVGSPGIWIDMSSGSLINYDPMNVKEDIVGIIELDSAERRGGDRATFLLVTY
jgi:hypothetical protein